MTLHCSNQLFKDLRLRDETQLTNNIATHRKSNLQGSRAKIKKSDETRKELKVPLLEKRSIYDHLAI